MITKEQVLEALSTVQEPDLKKDLVTLNMISDVLVEGTVISFTVLLTTPACPLKEKIESDCVHALKEKLGNDITVHVKMTSNVTSTRDASINILPSVRNIICVASGKGGVGKSTVSVNLALALAKTGAKVGLIDADIHGPSIPTMLDLRTEKPQVREIKGKHYMVPIEKHGIKILSIGLLVDERQAIVWRGAMVTSALKQFITDCIWGELDYLILDMPPGTGDVHLTMIQTVQVTGAVIVTTPQEVALADARKAVAMFRMPSINVPVLGVVENMAYFTPAELPNNKYYIFGKDGGKQLADEYDMEFLGQVPLVQSIREAADNGTPKTLETESIEASYYTSIAQNVAQQVAVWNARKAAVEVGAE